MALNEAKDYVIENGLGKITFSKGILRAIINKILVIYPRYTYVDHKIRDLQDNYLEVSIYVKSSDSFDAKVTEKLEKELLLILRKSLSLNCVLALNINYGK